MIEKKDFVAAFINSIYQSNFFNEFEVKNLDSGEVQICAENKGILQVITIRFKLSDFGNAPTSIEHWIRHNRVEHVIQPIALKNGLKYSFDAQHTFAASIKNKELYRTITSGKLNLSEFEKSLSHYLSEEINPFFFNYQNIENIGTLILNKEFEEIVNMGFGGEYPVNILKAIAITKWSGNLKKYEDLIKSLQIWIDEDRDNPSYTQVCDSYQKALDELKNKLESIT